MASTEHFDIKPHPTSALELAQEVSRMKSMLVTTIIGSVFIVVVAALFMTMF
jgi:hypothetical protein